MTAQTVPPLVTTGWTAREGHALRRPRARYRRDRDLFTVRERAHLCFLRRLVRTGRLVS
ncbi:MAG: hypothetical protein ACRDGS_03330 [Chloroflexota bacterium]